MALELFIHPCIHDMHHVYHPPPLDEPLRIVIQGPLETIQKLMPDAIWESKDFRSTFPQSGGPRLARLTYQKLYGRDVRGEIDGDLVVRDEYVAHAMDGRRPLDYIDYYGVTFDHLVPTDQPNPPVLAISLIELDNDGGAFAKKVLPFAVDPKEFTGKKVLAVPRCCQIKKGTQDRGRVNALVAARDKATELNLGDGNVHCEETFAQKMVEFGNRASKKKC